MPAIQPNDGFEWTQEPWGAALRCRPLGLIAQHLFTIGNLELRDNPREWASVTAALGVSPGDLLLISQVHGRGVAVAQANGSAAWSCPEADVIVSADPSVALAVRVADCAPVLLADARTGAAGAAHAGWRGTVQQAAAVAVEAMEREFGTNPRDLVVAIGPCLGSCCGEVGEEVVRAFREAGHPARDVDRWFTPGRPGKAQLDLWGANRDQLVRAGVPPGNIHVAALCTKTHANLFHSYRAQGTRAGRMVAAIRASRVPGITTRDV